MKTPVALALSGLFCFATTFAVADDLPEFAPQEATELSLDDFKWIARPIVVFADTSADPRFQQQLDRLEAEWPVLADRDVVVITDTDPDDPSEVRKKLRPRGFMMTLIAKDGTVALRKPQPWTVREITRTIDKMPDREQEIRDRRSN
ncbi:MAG: DUF4174 domain-containing protein [Pseudoruegeria sp.]